MVPVTTRKRMLNVRVDEQVMERLDEEIAQARRAGRKVTKERLVADAITRVYPGRDTSLPVHQAEWVAPVDPRSTRALLDFLDDSEGAS